MYFGSVRFFKHVIYTALVLIFLVPLTLMVYFAVKYNSLKASVELPASSSVQLVIQTDTPEIPEQSLDDICLLLKKQNYPANEIMDALENHDIAVMDYIFKSRFENTSGELEYTTDYPELYAEAPTEFVYEDNTIYLTFDDGPSENTMMILSILDKYNIKATFFICGNNISDRTDYILNEIVKRGHTIGIHSYTHDLSSIYQSVDTFLEDFYDTYNYIYETTGVKPEVFRFPGGSINGYNSLIYREIIAEMSRRGFVYYDWNASGEDAAAQTTWTSIYNSVISSMENKTRGIILLHDGADKYTTVTVVEDLILYFQNRSYKFDKITNEVKPVTFGYLD